MDSRALGTLVIVAGVAAVLIGLVIFSGAVSWFGRLPGDFRVERENVRVYVPIVSMLLVSAGISILIALLRRLF